MESLDDFLFRKPEFRVSEEPIDNALEFVRRNPRDCLGFTLLIEYLRQSYGDPDGPYFKQMSDASGRMAQIHLDAVEKARDIHISPCQFSKEEKMKGPFDEPGGG